MLARQFIHTFIDRAYSCSLGGYLALIGIGAVIGIVCGESYAWVA